MTKVPTTTRRIMAHVLRDWAYLQSAKDFLRPRAYSVNLVAKPDSFFVLEKPTSTSSPDVSVSLEAVSLEEEILSSLST